MLYCITHDDEAHIVLKSANHTTVALNILITYVWMIINKVTSALIATNHFKCKYDTFHREYI